MKEYSVFTTSHDDNKVCYSLNVSATKALYTVYGYFLFGEMSDEDFFGEEYDKYNIYNIADFLLSVEDGQDCDWIITSVNKNGKIEKTYPSEAEVLEWWKNMIEKEIEYRKE